MLEINKFQLLNFVAYNVNKIAKTLTAGTSIIKNANRPNFY